MPSTNSVKVSIVKEVTAGTAIDPTAVVPIKSLPGLDRTIEKATDPVIIGAGMAAGEFPVSASVKGGLSISPRSCPAFGHILKGTFGGETAAPPIVVGAIRIKYTGASASCKLVAAGSTITAYKGALGSEAADTEFYASTGILPLTNALYDTPAELAAVIEAMPNYECDLITGADGTITGVYACTVQAKDQWALFILTGSGTGAYAHQFTANLTAGSERPTYTVQLDNMRPSSSDNMRYAGCSINSLSLSAALKATLEGDIELIGFTETIANAAMSALALNDSKPFIFAGGIVSIAGADYNYVRNVTLKAENNLKDDGYGQASLDRAYHAKGMFSLSGDLKLRLDATSILERPKVASGVFAPIFLYFYAAESKKIGTSVIAEMLIIEIPYAELSAFAFEDNGGIVDCSISWKAFKPGGTLYNEPVTVTLISTDSAVY